ncbi:MAG: SLBB domain-containing protein [Hydrogenophaga sp.]|jgi:protein involved in polysaccharide export with SLBB domain|nr:SLBB domain-containing protein [Hydrogenophaga sp.]
MTFRFNPTVARRLHACAALALCLSAVPVVAQVQLAAPAEAGSAAGMSAPASLLSAPPTSRNTAPAPVAATAQPAAPNLLAAQRANAASDVYGAQLFTGAFTSGGATQFNPDYLIATGDTLQLRLWGAFTFDAPLTVDPQGNIFLPHVGPVTVRGVRNADLQTTVEAAVRRTFRANVSSYASLAAAQPVRVFVGGNVVRPGLYGGTSMDSLLHYLDQAGGIDTERGSFLAVQVKRGSTVRASFNLYDFLLSGTMPLLQLADGDVIFVPQRQSTVRINGLAENAKRLEFPSGQNPTVAALASIAKPLPQATHVRVVRNTGTQRNTEYFALGNAASVTLQNGDELEFTADKKPGTITVRVEGEHTSPQEYVLPYGTRLGALLQDVQLTPDAEPQSVQLFRRSVKERQKEMLTTSLRSLEAALLTARSGSSDEARLRKEEAELTLQWVDRAKQVEPLGQVVVAQATQRNDLLLENGDVLRIPRRDGLVLVSGEVLFPNAVAFEPGLSLQQYIDRAGGYTQVADNSRVVVARRDGSFEQADAKRLLAQAPVRPGDQILVLPKVDEKQRQFWKDMTQIIYQIAVSAKVVFGL